jgi:hypothetical protein
MQVSSKNKSITCARKSGMLQECQTPVNCQSHAPIVLTSFTPYIRDHLSDGNLTWNG